MAEASHPRSDITRAFSPRLVHREAPHHQLSEGPFGIPTDTFRLHTSMRRSWIPSLKIQVMHYVILVYEEYYLVDRLLLVVDLAFDSEPVPSPLRVTSQNFKEPSQSSNRLSPSLCGD